jgi:hypothetical protein
LFMAPLQKASTAQATPSGFCCDLAPAWASCGAERDHAVNMSGELRIPALRLALNRPRRPRTGRRPFNLGSQRTRLRDGPAVGGLPDDDGRHKENARHRGESAAAEGSRCGVHCPSSGETAPALPGAWKIKQKP